MIQLLEVLTAALLVLGGIFGLIGSFGLLKLQDTMQRLHAPTKATTIGVGATLIASALGMVLAGKGISWQEVLVALFLFLTAPLSALFLARVHIFHKVARTELPDPGTGSPWATLDDRPAP